MLRVFLLLQFVFCFFFLFGFSLSFVWKRRAWRHVTFRAAVSIGFIRQMSVFLRDFIKLAPSFVTIFISSWKKKQLFNPFPCQFLKKERKKRERERKNSGLVSMFYFYKYILKGKMFLKIMIITYFPSVPFWFENGARDVTLRSQFQRKNFKKEIKKNAYASINKLCARIYIS